MSDARGQSDLPTAFDVLESVLLLVTGAAVATPVLPGFTLCVPGLILLAVVVRAPLVAAAALITLAGAILAIPCMLVRSLRGIRSRRTGPAPESAPLRDCRDRSAAADTARRRAVAAPGRLG